MQIQSSSHSVDTSHERSAGNIKLGKAPVQNDQSPYWRARPQVNYFRRSLSTHGQRQVAELLRTAPEGGLAVSLISERIGITKENVYEKLKKLARLGWTEEGPLYLA
jgi:GTP-sensing pleiotropic transcriptional regulator CodY